jgi:hypothetical protein
LYRALGQESEARAEMASAGKLTQAADDDLFKKIANGRQHPPQAQDAPAPDAPH